MNDVQMTAMAKAIELAEQYLAEARAIAKANVASCIRYLQAAQAALHGLEDEFDQILLEAKVVARFQWQRRPDLLARIDDYLNRYRLAPVLGEAIRGIEECHAFAKDDVQSFLELRRGRKLAALDEVPALLEDLSGFLGRLGSSMAYDRENYAGPSGIDVPVLLEIERLLLAGGDVKDERAGEQIVQTVDGYLRHRRRKGLQHADDATRVIQKLMNAFGVSVPARERP